MIDELPPSLGDNDDDAIGCVIFMMAIPLILIGITCLILLMN